MTFFTPASLRVATFCWASIWKTNSLPSRRAGSPVHASAGPSTANFTPAACSSCAVALVAFFARSSSAPAQPTQYRYSTSPELGARLGRAEHGELHPGGVQQLRGRLGRLLRPVFQRPGAADPVQVLHVARARCTPRPGRARRTSPRRRAAAARSPWSPSSPGLPAPRRSRPSTGTPRRPSSVHASAGPSTANFTPAACSSCAVALVAFFARSSSAPAQPTQYRYSTSPELGARLGRAEHGELHPGGVQQLRGRLGRLLRPVFQRPGAADPVQVLHVA